MTVGQRYEVQYHAVQSRSDWIMVGTYLGLDAWGGRCFDCRPVCGTQTLPASWPITRQVETKAEHRGPRKVGY
jgi:hypothetical protein